MLKLNLQFFATSGEFTYSDNGDGTCIIESYDSVGDVVIPDTLDGLTVTTIAPHSFSNRLIKYVTFPDTIVYIDFNAFQGNGLKEITFPDSLNIIAEGAFSQNDLTSVVVPKSVSRIDNFSFHDNDITEVKILNSETVFNGYGIFGSNPSSLTIVGYDPSTAKDYAIARGYNFDALSIPPVTLNYFDRYEWQELETVKGSQSKADQALSDANSYTFDQVSHIEGRLDDEIDVVWDYVDKHKDDFTRHNPYAVTSGTASAYTISVPLELAALTTTYKEGMTFRIKIHTNSGSNPTLNVNGWGAKALKNSNGNVARFNKDSVYTVCYSGTDFILQGEGGEYGNATASQVLQYRTIGTESGIVEGTMPDRKAWNIGIGANNVEFTIPMGYHNGQGKIKVELDDYVIRPGINWSLRVSAEERNWESVCYGNGIFVAVSRTPINKVMISYNAIDWATTSAPNASWWSICYGKGLFVVVGSGSEGIMTSPDGINWTTRANPATNEWRSVTYGNGLFVAVSQSGAGNRVMTSPDGITWTLRNSASDILWRSVTYGNGLFVAVANSGTGNRIMTSPNGITWTSRASANDSGGWISVTYGNGLFVATSASGTGNRVMTSPDGITWTLRNSTDNNNSWRSVTYGNGLFVAVANSGTGNRIMTSPNGITWTSRASANDSNWSCVCYGNGHFVTIADITSGSGVGNRVITSGVDF